MKQLLQVWVVPQEVEGLDLVADMAGHQFLPVVSACQQEVDGGNEEMWTAPRHGWQSDGLPANNEGSRSRWECWIATLQVVKCEELRTPEERGH